MATIPNQLPSSQPGGYSLRPKMAAQDGATLNRISDQDGVEGYIRKYWQLAWQKLNCHFMVEDINDIATADRTHS